LLERKIGGKKSKIGSGLYNVIWKSNEKRKYGDLLYCSYIHIQALQIDLCMYIEFKIPLFIFGCLIFFRQLVQVFQSHISPPPPFMTMHIVLACIIVRKLNLKRITLDLDNNMKLATWFVSIKKIYLQNKSTLDIPSS